MARQGAESKQTCAACGKHASGNFCHHCGSPLGARFCTQCGAGIAPSVAFCTQCGAKAPGGTETGAPAKRPAGGRRGGAGKQGSGGPTPAVGTRGQAAAAAVGGANAPLWNAGVAMFGLILVVGWSMVRPGEPTAPAGMGGGAASPGAAGNTDLSQLSPTERADRLFQRVMEYVAAGKSDSVLFFAPMAIQAFQVAEPLDLDGVFHMAMIQQLSDPAGALATAKRMLESEPDHILGLGVAAESSAALGDEGAAREYYSRLLQVYDVQFARTLAEYEGHRTVLTQMRAEAQAFLAR